MLISPFTPLSFTEHKTDGIESPYIQVFSPWDKILIEVFCTPDEDVGVVELFAEPGHILIDTISFSEWEINDDTRLLFAQLSPGTGFFTLQIGGYKSNVFKVTDNAFELSQTTLIQYSHRNNLQRTDVAFFIDRMQYFFDLRVHGGFKDSDWAFGIDNEQFVTPLADISQLFAMESTQKKFTLGDSRGVPVWFGEMLNRILTCSHVYFDGVKYVRKESSVPEMTTQLEGVNSFVFTQLLQQSHFLDPVIEQTNQALIRRYNNTEYRKTDNYHNRIIN